MWKLILTAAAVLAVFSYSVIPSFVVRHMQTWRRKQSHSGEKILYLTFDDGPGKDTESLLDLLKAYDIRASFFVVAKSALKYPHIIARAAAEGHLVGIHSVHHNDALFRGNRYTYSDMAESLFALKRLGCDITYYRPPWGHLNLFTLWWVKMLNLRLTLWDVMAQDWKKNADPELICSRIMQRVYKGAVICLHDARGAEGAPAGTVAALREALPKLLENGYKFKRLDDE